MNGALRVERLAGRSALLAFAPEWAELCAAARATPPCNEPWWVLAHSAAFSGSTEPFALVARDADGRAHGYLPLVREPRRAWWALCRLRHAADGHFDSEMLEPLCRPGREREVVDVLLDALARERGAHALLLFCAPTQSPALLELQAALARRGWPLRRQTHTYLVATLGDSFDATVAGLKSRMRSKVRAALRSLDEQQVGARFVERADELEASLAALYELHQARWTSEGKAGSFADPRRRAFYGAFARAALEQGRLRLALLERAGRPLAAQLGIVTRGAAATYTQLQEGYAPGEAEWRPATALRAWAIRALVEDGIRRVDFQEGDAPHKRDWGAVEVPCETLVIALPTLRARAEFALRERLGR
jgi:CelD/BcsL family acetyltransferase involved in cellulose biosynthesis